MSGYKELREEYNLEKEQFATIGTRAFINTTTGTASLPELGDPFSIEYPNCLARKIKVKLYHVRTDQSGCDKDGKKYIVEYSTRDNSGSISTISRDDPDQIRFTGGLESFKAERPVNWFWELPSALDPIAQTPPRVCEQPLILTTPKGGFSKVVKKNTGLTFQNYWSNQLILKVGRLNEEDFYPDGNGIIGGDIVFVPGTVLFHSFGFEKVKNNDGDIIWLTTLNFEYRILNALTAPDTITPNIPYSYQYIFNKDGEVGSSPWQAPCFKNDGGNIYYDYLYAPITFAGLLT